MDSFQAFYRKIVGSEKQNVPFAFGVDISETYDRFPKCKNALKNHNN